MRRIFLKISFCLSILLLLQLNLGASQDEEMINFRYMSQQAIDLNLDSSFFVIEIEPAIFGTMDQSLRDLRLFAEGYELGYAQLPINIGNRNIEQDEQDIEVINQAQLLDGSYSFTMITKNIGQDQSIKVVLAEDPLLYLVKGTLYGSNDNRNWQELRPITLYGINNTYSEIPLAGIDYDYLKINYNQSPEEKLTVQSVSSQTTASEEIDLSSFVAMPFAVHIGEANQESAVIIDLEHQNRLSSALIIDTSEEGFYRKVFVEGSNDKNNWNLLKTTYIYSGAGPTDKKLSISYRPSYYQYLRLRIVNEDNLPIEINSVQVKAHHIKIIAKVPQALQDKHTDSQLTAYWGNEVIKSPSYDVPELINNLATENYYKVQLAEKTNNPNYNPGTNIPISERYPFLLTLGLIGTVLVVGYILNRNIRWNLN